MCENVNINVSETNETINIVATEVQEVIDINVFETAEDVTLNITEQLIQVNVNKVTAAEQIQSDWAQTDNEALDFIKNKPTIPTNTSDLINDGEDGVNPFITANDIPPVTGFVPYTGATEDVNLGEYELKAGQLTLDTTPTGTAAVATTQWNDTAGVSQTTLKGGTVALKNGVDLVARVVNKVTPNATLLRANYTAVRISGAQGQRLAVAYAQANNDNNSADTIGLVCENIATNQEGFIMTMGQFEEINTTGSLQGETWADGDVLYLSPTTAGRLTNIKPTGLTGHIVVMGYVEYAHAIHGKIYVKIMNGWELDELHNVYINSPLNNDGLFYDSADSLWKNKTIAAALGYTPVTNARTISTTAPLSGGGDLSANRTLSITQSTTSTDGYLSSTDWNTFNNKQASLFDFQTKKGFYLFEDFLGDNTASNFNSFGWSNTFTATGYTITFNTSYPNRTNQQGVYRIASGVAASGSGLFRLGTTTASLFFGQGEITFETFVNIETLSTATERFWNLFGFSNTSSLTVAPNQIFIAYDEGGIYSAASPNFKCITRNTAVTSTTTSVPVVASQWYKLKIIINAAATSVGFYIDGVLVATHTTNIPTSSTPYLALSKTAGTTSRNIYIDYAVIQQIYTNPR